MVTVTGTRHPQTGRVYPPGAGRGLGHGPRRGHHLGSFLNRPGLSRASTEPRARFSLASPAAFRRSTPTSGTASAFRPSTRHHCDEEFYRANAATIDRLRQPTLDFTTGEPTARLYTRAKVVDMIFVIEGGYPSGAASPNAARPSGGASNGM